MKKYIMVALFFSVAFAGSVVSLFSKSGMNVYGLKPVVVAGSADTLGPISIHYASALTVGTMFGALTGTDTTVVDSSFTFGFRYSPNRKKTNLLTPDNSDSLITYSARLNYIKGLTLVQSPYLWLVVKRTDTGADTLDMKQANGVIDSSLITINVRELK